MFSILTLPCTFLSFQFVSWNSFLTTLLCERKIPVMVYHMYVVKISNTYYKNKTHSKINVMDDDAYCKLFFFVNLYRTFKNGNKTFSSFSCDIICIHFNPVFIIVFVLYKLTRLSWLQKYSYGNHYF